MRRIVVSLIAGALAACGTDAPSGDAAADAGHATPPAARALPPGAGPDDARVSHWQCGEFGVMARFLRKPERVVLFANGLRWTLPIAVSGSGVRYADGAGAEFRTRGATGTLTLDGDATRACTEAARPSPWNQALLDGLAFRGAGNEPGWFVEVGGGAAPALRATLDYGERELMVARVARTRDGYAGKATDGDAVSVRILQRSCRDGMSGQPFPATVELDVGGQAYRGCGARFDDPGDR
jgi:uncharacterized membrane protein